jgi:uncharacterized protein (DUF1778 family)
MKLLALRAQLNPKPMKGEENADAGHSVMDFVVKAASSGAAQVL